jgi:hypothetical protein
MKASHTENPTQTTPISNRNVENKRLKMEKVNGRGYRTISNEKYARKETLPVNQQLQRINGMF